MRDAPRSALYDTAHRIRRSPGVDVLDPGTVVDKYVVEALIGEGGMASVYRVRHKILGGQRALKVLKPDMARRRAVRERFLAEARIQHNLRHDNLVAVHDVVESEAAAGFVMDLLDGCDLGDHLKRHGPMPLADVVGLARQLLDVLSYVHSQGIVHRDLKPANLFVTPTPGGLHLRLTDFGIAKVVSDQRTRSTAKMGTPEYMSPEQFESAAAADARSDLFAAAAILYELLACRPYFGLMGQEGTNTQMLVMVWRAAAVPLSEVVPGIPEALAEVVHKGLARDPDARFQSAAAFRVALDAAVEAGLPPLPEDAETARRESLALRLAEQESVSSSAEEPPEPPPADEAQPPGEHRPTIITFDDLDDDAGFFKPAEPAPQPVPPEAIPLDEPAPPPAPGGRTFLRVTLALLIATVAGTGVWVSGHDGRVAEATARVQADAKAAWAAVETEVDDAEALLGRLIAKGQPAELEAVSNKAGAALDAFLRTWDRRTLSVDWERVVVDIPEVETARAVRQAWPTTRITPAGGLRVRRVETADHGAWEVSLFEITQAALRALGGPDSLTDPLCEAPDWAALRGDDKPAVCLTWVDAAAFANALSAADGLEPVYLFDGYPLAWEMASALRDRTDPLARQGAATQFLSRMRVVDEADGWRLPTIEVWRAVTADAEEPPLGTPCRLGNLADTAYAAALAGAAPPAEGTDADALDEEAAADGQPGPDAEAEADAGDGVAADAAATEEAPGTVGCTDRVAGLTRVGGYAQHAGLYDALGNAWEWTQASGDPVPVAGGGWRSGAAESTLTARREVPAGTVAPDLGFRVVRRASP